MPKTSEEVVSEAASKALLDLKGKVTGKRILQSISNYCDANDFMLYGLMGAGIIKNKMPARKIKDYQFTINEERVKDIQLLKGLLFSRETIQDEKDIFDIVASFPKSEEFKEVKGIESLYPRLCRLIISCNEELMMVNPFFDKEGLEKIMPYIIRAAERDVGIKVISRQKFDSDPKQEEQLNLMLNGLKGRCELRRFGGKVGANPYHLHAKFMVSDSNKAYVGSANITKTSLGNNAEVGIIFSGGKAKYLENFFRVLWKKSSIN